MSQGWYVSLPSGVNNDVPNGIGHKLLPAATARARHDQLEQALYGLVVPPDLCLERIQRLPLLLDLVLQVSQLAERGLQRLLRQSASRKSRYWMCYAANDVEDGVQRINVRKATPRERKPSVCRKLRGAAGIALDRGSTITLERLAEHYANLGMLPGTNHRLTHPLGEQDRKSTTGDATNPHERRAHGSTYELALLLWGSPCLANNGVREVARMFSGHISESVLSTHSHQFKPLAQ